MTKIEDLKARVRDISDAITAHVRTEPANNSLAGWGQFVEAASPVFQIGPYGTAAGIVVNQIAFPDSQVDGRVKTQLRHFWDMRPAGKMFPQNVRLAFTVLALGRTKDPELQVLSSEIVATLVERQLSDGSWGDAPPHPTSPAGGRTDATAWTVLALRRHGGPRLAMEKGAAWLADRAEHFGDAQLLSTIGLAGAIAGHANAHSVAGLRAHGFEVIARATVNREELISFFDYEEQSEGKQIQSRDYLCYPAFYPLAVLAAALAEGAGPFELIRLDAFRANAIEKMISLSNGSPYKAPSARFSSTVDQAMYALAYEELAASGSGKVRGTIARIYKRSRRSIFVQLILPIVGLFALAAAIAYPTSVVSSLRPVLGNWEPILANFVENQKAAIQVFAGLAATLLFATPKSGRQILWDRLRGLRRDQ
ncbi:hypothetical protein [Mesorhizobium sp. B1-1-5]|uniref:hypothetical protein n=1 Tax=Mesorhizobium sp. B1-1-5 TaxID=2589979 RepID=UPI00112AF7E1|nr:hypothetical protein [Mesorhizobium sp. B1-1-5]TPO13757.1 hypothetical protein FJ980_00860 [Mesorhizobium sp. B1-1-5]